MVAWPYRRKRWSCVEMPRPFICLKTELLIPWAVLRFRGDGFIGASFFCFADNFIGILWKYGTADSHFWAVYNRMEKWSTCDELVLINDCFVVLFCLCVNVKLPARVPHWLVIQTDYWSWLRAMHFRSRLSLHSVLIRKQNGIDCTSLWKVTMWHHSYILPCCPCENLLSGYEVIWDKSVWYTKRREALL